MCVPRSHLCDSFQQAIPWAPHANLDTPLQDSPSGRAPFLTWGGGRAGHSCSTREAAGLPPLFPEDTRRSGVAAGPCCGGLWAPVPACPFLGPILPFLCAPVLSKPCHALRLHRGGQADRNPVSAAQTAERWPASSPCRLRLHPRSCTRRRTQVPRQTHQLTGCPEHAAWLSRACGATLPPRREGGACSSCGCWLSAAWACEAQVVRTVAAGWRLLAQPAAGGHLGF